MDGEQVARVFATPTRSKTRVNAPLCTCVGMGSGRVNATNGTGLSVLNVNRFVCIAAVMLWPQVLAPGPIRSMQYFAHVASATEAVISPAVKPIVGPWIGNRVIQLSSQMTLSGWAEGKYVLKVAMMCFVLLVVCFVLLTKSKGGRTQPLGAYTQRLGVRILRQGAATFRQGAGTRRKGALPLRQGVQIRRKGEGTLRVGAATRWEGFGTLRGGARTATLGVDTPAQGFGAGGKNIQLSGLGGFTERSRGFGERIFALDIKLRSSLEASGIRRSNVERGRFAS